MGRKKEKFKGIWKSGEEWARKCPCDKKSTIFHKSRISAKNSHKQKRKCRKCGCGHFRGKTKETCESLNKMAKRVSKTMKKKFENGELEPWNKGLTKESSEILNKISANRRGSKHSEETKKIIGEQSKKRWEAGVYDDQIKYDDNLEFRRYQNEVYKLTETEVDKIEGYDESKRGKCGASGAYQVHHKIPVSLGYELGLPTYALAYWRNLEFISWEENLRIGSNYDWESGTLRKLNMKEEWLPVDYSPEKYPSINVYDE